MPAFEAEKLTDTMQRTHSSHILPFWHGSEGEAGEAFSESWMIDD